MRRACTDVEWFDDYQVGDEFLSEPVEFTENEIVEFALRYDPQPFHIDREAAKSITIRRLHCFRYASFPGGMGRNDTGWFSEWPSHGSTGCKSSIQETGSPWRHADSS